MNDLAFRIRAWAALLPTTVRKRFYQGVKWVGILATLAVLVLPELDAAGLHWSYETTALAVASALVGLTGHIADSNTFPEPLADMSPAPEPTGDANLTPPPAS